MSRFLTKPCIWFSILGFVFTSIAAAQANPLVNLPSGDLTCTVTVTDHGVLKGSIKADEAPAVPKSLEMKTVVITQVGRLRSITMTWPSGKTTQAWLLTDTGLMLYERTSQSSSVIQELPRGTSGRFFPPLLNLNAASVAWITPESFTGKTAFRGNPALHYQATVQDNTLDPDDPPTHAVYQAWINPKTLAPLAFDDGDSLYEFTFSDEPPSSPLIMPDRFRKELQDYENANAKPKHL